MELSLGKCESFQYVAKNKTWYVKDPNIDVDGTKIQHCGVGGSFRYVGAKVCPWGGLGHVHTTEEIDEVLGRLKKLSSKPLQKIQLLKTNILTRYTYGLIVSPPSNLALQEVDNTIRKRVKEMLHLPQSISTHFPHTPLRQGGLGIPKLEHLVTISSLRNGMKAENSKDTMMKEVCNTKKNLKVFRDQDESLGTQWPVAVAKLDEIKNKLREEHGKKWAEQKWQGQGVQENKEGNDSCRNCGREKETIGHIIRQCQFTKAKRIHRHNEIVEIIKCKNKEKNRTVLEEPVLKVQGQRLKPDLVMKMNEGQAYIVDVTVRYENKNSLEEAAEEKRNKYSVLSNQIKKMLQVEKVDVLAVVVGSRGAMPGSTKQALKKSDSGGTGDLSTISLIALRSSIEIISAFMDQ
ncbi:hypothetical protein QAD02_011684 [Eretmocerus hayati]|uniref:Uncharacterized protein n=1 Tax=Eretmocerus hayati TaxID=131215 RepID=A0ACC2NYF1_9HYME|nr:hypothetical protein QAD02_011684 [Eretmocerus hayati]